MSPALRHLAAVHRALYAAGLAVIVLTSVGCSTQQHAEADGKPDTKSTPTLLDGAALKLPVDTYLFSPAQLRPLWQAHRVLVGQCMLRFGFDYRPPERPARVGPRTAHERRYGVTDEAAVAVHGYELADRSVNSPLPPSRRDGPAMPPSYRRSSRAA